MMSPYLTEKNLPLALFYYVNRTGRNEVNRYCVPQFEELE